MGALALTSKDHSWSPFEPVMPSVALYEYGKFQAFKPLLGSAQIASVFVGLV